MMDVKANKLGDAILSQRIGSHHIRWWQKKQEQLRLLGDVEVQKPKTPKKLGG